MQGSQETSRTCHATRGRAVLDLSQVLAGLAHYTAIGYLAPGPNIPATWHLALAYLAPGVIILQPFRMPEKNVTNIVVLGQ